MIIGASSLFSVSEQKLWGMHLNQHYDHSTITLTAFILLFCVIFTK